MGQIQDVTPNVYIEWRRESVVIGEQDGSCEIAYEDLQALVCILASSAQSSDTRFMKWERGRKP